MGIILKENNLIYTKKRHDKFLGSSRYKYDKVKNTIYKKEKLIPNVPNVQDEIINIEELEQWLQSSKEFHNTDCIITALGRKPQPPKKTKVKKTAYTLNKKLVREKCAAFFGLKQSRKFLAFYSISFPLGFPDDLAFTCLNIVLTRLRDDCGLKSYLWVAERQKNETAHFHLLTNNFMYVRKVNYYMAKAIQNQIKKHKLKVNFNLHKYNGVDVRHVNNNRKALNIYLTKYVSKNTAVFHRSTYRSSHDISELFTAESFDNIHDSDFKYIYKTIKHIQTFVVDNEWCTIEYLCQKQANGKYFNPPDEWYWLRDYLNEQIYKNHRSEVKFNVLTLR